MREVAEIFRISRSTAYREVQRFLDTGGREGIPVILVGGQRRIPRQKLEPLAGGPIHLLAADAGPCELPAVVELREHRANKPSRRFKRTTSGPSTDSPNDIG
ncbi:MAG: helix-turn-helix domain-containing protein [Acidimicrobiales bacterium]